ncbi:hypothetical protein N8368_01125 [Bacteroidia bacterium]|nr:hypothetical protein [Bacteroidia bacterium]MDC1395089.1 hypothetical protein [Bacteroidia bacterium]
MRILSFAVILTLSHFTKGQNVLTNFEDTLVYDNFNLNEYNFPQKYTSAEISIIENGVYRIKRLSDKGRSISYLKYDKAFYAYEISADIELLKSGSSPSAGVILNGQLGSNGGILLELNNKKRFRVNKLVGEQIRILSGSAKDNGWVKCKYLKKSGINQISVKVENGYYDLYFNDHYIYTIYDTQFEGGKVGLLSGPSSEVLAHNFTVKKAKSSIDKITEKVSAGNENGGNVDPDFQELILIFKTKIDQQQIQIANLQQEVDKCKSMLNYDTSLVSKTAVLEKTNRELRQKLDVTTRELNRDKKRLEYLESLKEDIEKGSNGDLVLNLTSILADMKKEYQSLKEKNQIAARDNEQLKKDNTVLLRKIERMEYMLDLKD